MRTRPARCPSHACRSTPRRHVSPARGARTPTVRADNVASTSAPLFDQDHARGFRLNRLRKSCASACLEISASAPASSTPVAPPPTTTNVSKLLLDGAITFSFGAFKSDEHLLPNRDRVFHRLQAAARAPPTRRGRSTPAAIRPRRIRWSYGTSPSASCTDLRRDIDGRGFRQPDFEVRLTAKDPANRRCDVAGRQRRGGHLIQQRRKHVMVASIDQQDVHRRCASARAAHKPPNPPPMITTRGRCRRRSCTAHRADADRLTDSTELLRQLH